MKAEKRSCEGPGHNGKACDRVARSGTLCPGHAWQKKTHGVLKPLLGPGGQKYVNAVKLEIRNLPPEMAVSLWRLGTTLPATDERESKVQNRAIRHLVTAWAEGRARLKASHHTDKATAPPAKRMGHVAMVCIAVDTKEANALKCLGHALPLSHRRDLRPEMRGVRWLIQAYHEGGLRILAHHAKKS